MSVLDKLRKPPAPPRKEPAKELAKAAARFPLDAQGKALKVRLEREAREEGDWAGMRRTLRTAASRGPSKVRIELPYRRPLTAKEFRKLVSESGEAHALQTILDCMESTDDGVALAAASRWIEYGRGKPKQQVEDHEEDGAPPPPPTIEIRLAPNELRAIAGITRRLAAAQGDIVDAVPIAGSGSVVRASGGPSSESDGGTGDPVR